MKKHNKGFTLAELLIVVAVIAVLVAVAIPTFSNQLEKSRQAVDISNLRGAYAAAKIAAMDRGVGTASFDADDAVLVYYYNVDTGELSVDGNATGDSYQCGKALGNAVIADTSNLDTSITYNVPTNTGGTGQRIKVTFVTSDVITFTITFT